MAYTLMHTLTTSDAVCWGTAVLTLLVSVHNCMLEVR